MSGFKFRQQQDEAQPQQAGGILRANGNRVGLHDVVGRTIATVVLVEHCTVRMQQVHDQITFVCVCDIHDHAHRVGLTCAGFLTSQWYR